MPHSRLRCMRGFRPHAGRRKRRYCARNYRQKRGTGAKPVPCPRRMIIAGPAYESNGFPLLARHPVQPRYGREHDRRLLFLNKLACPADGFHPEGAKLGFEQLPLFIRDLGWVGH